VRHLLSCRASSSTARLLYQQPWFDVRHASRQQLPAATLSCKRSCISALVQAVVVSGDTVDAGLANFFFQKSLLVCRFTIEKLETGAFVWKSNRWKLEGRTMKRDRTSAVQLVLFVFLKFLLWNLCAEKCSFMFDKWPQRCRPQILVCTCKHKGLVPWYNQFISQPIVWVGCVHRL
jgi:hypothetical protein